MSENTVGRFTFSEKLVKDLELINKPLNEITIDDCFILLKEKDRSLLKENDGQELLDLWNELYEKYGISSDINEVYECIDTTINVIINIWNEYSWNFSSHTLKYFLRSIVEVEYNKILSFSHLIILINYYMYNDKLNYYEKHYTGDDKVGIYFKQIWDTVEDDMHSCEFCEHIGNNTEFNNDYILLSKEEKIVKQ